MTTEVSAPRQGGEITEWLAHQHPADVDKALQWRASRLGVGLRLETSTRFPRDEKGNALPPEVSVRGCEVTGSIGQAQAMAETVRQAMTPAETAQIEEWLAELSVLVVRRPDDEFGDALRLTAYAQRLADYPADVARAALLEHRWKFWPAWEELAAVCDKLVKARRVWSRQPARRRPARKPSARRRRRPDEILPAAPPHLRRHDAAAGTHQSRRLAPLPPAPAARVELQRRRPGAAEVPRRGRRGGRSHPGRQRLPPGRRLRGAPNGPQGNRDNLDRWKKIANG